MDGPDHEAYRKLIPEYKRLTAQLRAAVHEFRQALGVMLLPLPAADEAKADAALMRVNRLFTKVAEVSAEFTAAEKLFLEKTNRGWKYDDPPD